MNRRNLFMFTVMLFATTSLAVPDVRAQGAPPATGALTVPLLDRGNADVVLTVQRFVQTGEQIFAVGRVTATVTRTNGVVNTVTQQVRIPLLLNQTAGTCDILNLVLGPLDLDLLGLQVHLDQIVLDIVAESGAGNLLGNLLCAVAGLLDDGGALAGLTDLLNQILGALG
jgi:hypothetical protein